MPSPADLDKPKILVIQNDFVAEMRLSLEYSGREADDPSAVRDKMESILRMQGIGAAILDTELDLDTAMTIADTLLELNIPFVFAGTHELADMPEHLIAQTMAQNLANLTVLGQSILGRPTYH